MSRAKISTFLKRMTSGVILTAIVATSFIQPVFATDSLIDLIQKGHLSNYIPGDVCTGQNTGVGSVLTDTELPTDIGASIEKFKPMYEAAAKEADIPWQMLAGVHYRENSFAENKDLQAGNPFGGPYSQQSTSYATFGYPKDLQASMVIAAKELQNKAEKTTIAHKRIATAAIDIALIKDTLFSYNGRAGVYAQQAATLGFDPATQPYEGSPYVMNRYDAKHTDMGIITTDGGKMDGIDKRFGAFTIYFLIGGPADGDSAAVGRGDCGGTGGGVGGTFDEIIKSYAWPDYHPVPPIFVTMKDGYREAVAAAKLNREYIGGTIYEAIDCGGFVTRVMRNSGTDKNYNAYNGNTIYQKRYMDDHPELYEKVPNVNESTGTKNLRKGDIAMNATHTYIYVDKIEGFNGNSASASWDERAPMASPAYGFSDFTWYRYKQPSTGGSSKPL